MTSTSAPATRVRRWPERPHPLRVELGTATARTASAPARALTCAATAEEATAASEAARARLATGRRDADGRGGHGAGRRRRTERTHTVTDGQICRRGTLRRGDRGGAGGRDLEVLSLGILRLRLRTGGFARVGRLFGPDETSGREVEPGDREGRSADGLHLAGRDGKGSAVGEVPSRPRGERWARAALRATRARPEAETTGARTGAAARRATATKPGLACTRPRRGCGDNRDAPGRDSRLRRLRRRSRHRDTVARGK